MSKRRVTFDYDREPDLSWLDQWNTPEKYLGNESLDENGKKLPFKKYLDYHGNPDHHVTLCMVVEEECEHCGAWRMVDSLYNIDFMDDDDHTVGTFHESTVDRITNGYQRELVAEAFGLKTEG